MALSDRPFSARGSTPLLVVDCIDVYYGKVHALRNVSLEVRQGEIVALIGANGAGKTTLLETVLGIDTPASGSVTFDGTRIEGKSSDHNARLGICLVPEGRGVFSTLSVLDNLLIGSYHARKGSAARLRRVFDLFPLLEERTSQIAASLSGGERRMLAIARALMAAPRLIMMDEPSLGLAPLVVEEVFSLLVRLNVEGFTVLLAEQNSAKALSCAHRGYILESGTLALSGTAEELRRTPAVRDAYLGV